MADYDKVTQASLNSLYVKAQELDRGHNENEAPEMRAPGHAVGCGGQRAADGFDTGLHASDAETRASDAESHASER